jgi:RNA polymerase sigma-70 factor, ECF subfamily
MMTASARESTLPLDSASAPQPNADAQLVAACLAGVAAAERALYDLHVDALHRAAFRLCSDPDITEDIIQEAFVLAFAGLSQFRGESSLRTWLISILVSVAGKTMRKGRWLRDHASDLNDRIPLPAEMLRDRDLAAHLAAAIAALPDKLRVVVVMHDVEGFTHIEIGAALGIRTGSSKARLSRARARLRAALAHHWEDRTL